MCCFNVHLRVLGVRSNRLVRVRRGREALEQRVTKLSNEVMSGKVIRI